MELLAGRHPYEDVSLLEAMMAIVDPVRRPSPRALGAEVSDAVEAVFGRALSVAREERHADAQEFWSALRAVAG